MRERAAGSADSLRRENLDAVVDVLVSLPIVLGQFYGWFVLVVFSLAPVAIYIPSIWGASSSSLLTILLGPLALWRLSVPAPRRRTE